MSCVGIFVSGLLMEISGEDYDVHLCLFFGSVDSYTQRKRDE